MILDLLKDFDNETVASADLRVKSIQWDPLTTTKLGDDMVLAVETRMKDFLHLIQSGI